MTTPAAARIACPPTNLLARICFHSKAAVWPTGCLRSGPRPSHGPVAWASPHALRVPAECAGRPERHRKTMDPERRRAPRKRPAEFTFIKLEQEFGGRLLNFSEEGLCFETMSPISENDLVQFWFSLRTLERVEGLGHIVWMNQARNVGGIRITHLSRTSRLKFQGWMGEAAKFPVASAGDDASTAFASLATAVMAEGKEPPQIPETPPPSIGAPRSLEVAVEHGLDSQVAKIEAGAPTASPARHWPISPGTEPSSHSVAGSEGRTGISSESSAADRPDVSESFTPRASASLSSQDAAAPAESGIATPAGTMASPDPAEALKWTEPIVTNHTWPEAGFALPDTHVGPFASDFLAAKERETPVTESSTSVEYQGQPAVEPRELVPLKRHLTAARRQFIRGAMLGILICAAIGVLVSKFSKPMGPNVSAQVSSQAATGNEPAAQALPNFEAPSSNHAQVVSIPAIARNLRTASRSGVSPVAKIIPGAVQHSSPSPAIDSGTAAAATTEQAAAQNAASTPPDSSVANAMTAYRPALLFEAPKLAFPAEPFLATVVAGSERSAGQSAPDTDVATSFPSFHGSHPVSTAQVGGEVRPARLIRSAQAVYPLAARSRYISGAVVIDAVVTAAGNVTQARVLSGPPLLHLAALEAAAEMKYEPALLDGKPTAQHVSITIKFRLP